MLAHKYGPAFAFAFGHTVQSLMRVFVEASQVVVTADNLSEAKRQRTRSCRGYKLEIWLISKSNELGSLVVRNTRLE